MDKYVNKVFSVFIGSAGSYLLYKAYFVYQEKTVYVATNAYQMKSYWSPYYIIFYGLFCLIMSYFLWRMKD